MWGTDGVRVFTVDDGWGGSSPPIGWHVCKRGDRFAALQPISMGLAGLYGAMALRMDHGSQYAAVLGHPAVLSPSPRPTASPSGHAEGTDHPWSSQLAELRDAVRDFVVPSGSSKNGYLTRRGTPRSQSGPPRETNLCPRNRLCRLSCREEGAYRLRAQFHLSRWLLSAIRQPATCSVVL